MGGCKQPHSPVQTGSETRLTKKISKLWSEKHNWVVERCSKAKNDNQGSQDKKRSDGSPERLSGGARLQLAGHFVKPIKANQGEWQTFKIMKSHQRRWVIRALKWQNRKTKKTVVMLEEKQTKCHTTKKLHVLSLHCKRRPLLSEPNGADEFHRKCGERKTNESSVKKISRRTCVGDRRQEKKN